MTWRKSYINDPTETVLEGEVWLGLEDHAGLFLWYDPMLAEQWIRSSTLGFQVNGWTRHWYQYEGEYYYDNGLNKYLWKGSGGWYISNRLGDCIHEEWDNTSENELEHQYIGDEWWFGTELEGDYEARGSLRGDVFGAFNGAPVEITLSFSGGKHTGLKGDPPFGEYREWTYTTAEGETDGSDYRYVGIARYTDQDDTEYLRSLEKVDDYYNYGAIYNDGAGWLIGSRNSAGGWYEGDEPNRDAPVTFVRKKTEIGQFPGDYNLTITFQEYIQGDSVIAGNVSEVGIWL